MNVLGISCFYHDSAAAIVRDGKVVVAAEEERFTRRKHDNGFPAEAVKFCLERAGVAGAALDAVAFYDKPLRKLERALSVAAQYPERSKALTDRHIRHFLHEGAKVPEAVAEACGYTGKIWFSEHHLSHAASAFFVSPYEEAAILTVDGVGEWATTAQYHGQGTALRQLREIRYPNSLGMFYATMTAYLGFEVNEGEYKVMGLASYGTPNFDREIGELMELHADGSFSNKLDFYAYMYSPDRMFTDRLTALLGPAREKSEPVTRRHMDIAASLQKLTERAVVGLAQAIRASTGSKNLCMAGGVAHNVVANTRIKQAGIFDNVFVQPASGDSGSAIGAAYLAYYGLSGAPRHLEADYDTCVGPDYADDEIEAALRARGANYVRCADEADLCRRTARLIADDFIVGWFQGRMEFGPRALGCRSILANACNPDMKDILNARVKFREDFRPFAPAVLEERVSDYFEWTGRSPYMLFTPQVPPHRHKDIPSVTHSDGSARVQTVSARNNPRFHRLISEFGAITGTPVVINTSFNIKGEPIVCAPKDAVNCFLGTEIDYLAIGNFIAEKAF